MLLLFQLAAFASYSLAIILMAGQAFYWKEDRRLFYQGAGKVSTWGSVCTFCATWLGAVPIMAVSMWFYDQGHVAFLCGVLSWFLGIIPLAVLIPRLRRNKALSIPEWVAKRFSDRRLRAVTAIGLLVATLLFLIIEFRAFTSIMSSMFDVKPFLSGLLICLFVVYTTFGGLPSVVRTDVLNLGLIVLGLAVAAGVAVSHFSNPLEVPPLFAERFPDLVRLPASPKALLPLVGLGLTWGLTVAANPVFSLRIVSASTRWDAISMVSLSPFILTFSAICLTLFTLCGKLLAPAVSGGAVESRFMSLALCILPPGPATLLFIALLAGVVSTANSHLLLASCCLCYDLIPEGQTDMPLDIVQEDRFILRNRGAILGITLVAILFSRLTSAPLLLLSRYASAFVVLTLLFPLYLNEHSSHPELFRALGGGVAVFPLLVWWGLAPEAALAGAVGVESVLLFVRPARKGGVFPP